MKGTYFNSLQRYAQSNDVMRYLALFMITLIVYSCKEDSKISVSPDATDFEKQYYKDYESPALKWGFIDKKGDYVMDPIYDDLRDFKNGLACVSYQGKWGMIDKDEKVVIPFKYLDISYFSEGLALVEDFNNKVFYINQNGEKAFDCPTQECYSFKGGRARFVDENLTGFIDKSGKILEELRYSSASDFIDGYCSVSLGQFSGIIDTFGNEIIPVEFVDVKITSGIAKVKTKNNVYQYYHIEKQSWIPGEYKRAFDFQDGLAVVESNEGYGLIDIKGDFTFFSKDKVRYLNEFRWSIKSNDGYRLVDKTGNNVTNDTFTNMFKFHCGIMGIEQDGAWGYIDTDGNYVLEPSLPIIWDCSEAYIRFISRTGFGFMDTTTQVVIAPKFFEVRDFVENVARAQQVY